MPGPWEKYQAAQPLAEAVTPRPWEKYGRPSADPSPAAYTNEDLSPAAMAPERDHSLGERAAQIGDEVGRGIALGARSGLKGLASVADLAVVPGSELLNRGFEAIGIDPGKATSLNDYIDAGWAKAGLPVPETTGERFADRIGQNLYGSVGAGGAGRILQGAESAIAQGVGRDLASNLGTQAAAAITSGAASQAAKEGGLGPAGEIAAGIAGAAVPSLPAGAIAATRGIFRGGEQGRRAVEQAINDFDVAGTTPTVGQATGSNSRLATEAALAKAPGAAGVMADKAAQQAEEIQRGVGNLASRLSPASEPAQAGLAIERGITGQGGFVDRFKANASKLYDQLDKYLPAGTRVPVTNTQAAAQELVEPIAGAPQLSRFFTNGKVADIKNALDADTVGPMAPLNRPDVLSEVQRRQFQAADQNAAIERQNAIRESLGLKAKPGVDPNADIPQLLDAATDGRLPYEAVKKLRTLVGQELANPSLASEVKSDAWRKLYAGLSADMEAAANQAGPEASQAWRRANNYFKAGQSRIEALDRVVDKAGGPEAVFNAATSGTKDGAFTIRNVMQSLQPDQQKVLSASVLRRLGAATPGTATEQGEFSISSFLTNYNRLSPQAKSVLFDRYGRGFRDDLDSIAKVAGTLRGAIKVGANPSGSASGVAHQAALFGLVSSILSQNWGAAAAIAGSAASTNVLARAMTSPVFVKWLAKSSSIPRSQWAGAISSLAQQANEKGDENASEAASALQKSLKEARYQQYQANGQTQ